jgi:hypothetical protein
VLHDIFSVPFEEIGAILERSPEAARQLASRARRRIRAANTTPHHDADAAAQQDAALRRAMGQRSRRSASPPRWLRSRTSRRGWSDTEAAGNDYRRLAVYGLGGVEA